MRSSPHIVICGAGLTGLTTAWHLKRSGVQVTVLEAGDAVGGVVRTTQTDGYLVEHGPNSCMLTPDLAELVGALNLTPLLRDAAQSAQRRYIVRDGRPLAVPMSPGAMLRSPLLSTAAKLRLLAEPFIARRVADSDESVADFVTRRLGKEVLTWAVDPFVSGVYAGDPAQLSIAHAFPRLAALEREHGSLIRGAIAAGRRSRAARARSGVPAARPRMVSFADGMGTLPRAIANDIGAENIQCGAVVTSVETEYGGVSVTVRRDGALSTLHADAIVSTLPLHALTALQLPSATHDAVAHLRTLPYPAVASLALGFRRSDVAHALDGFGCLIPSAEQRKTLGVLFSSTLFDGRAPDDHVLLTCFIGGVRHPALGTASAQTLVELVTSDLRALLGVTAAPTFVHRTSWPAAIPQYNLGHASHARAAEEIESVVPGLLVDGQFRRGVSVGDCVAAGDAIAERALGLDWADDRPTGRPRHHGAPR